MAAGATVNGTTGGGSNSHRQPCHHDGATGAITVVLRAFALAALAGVRVVVGISWGTTGDITDCTADRTADHIAGDIADGNADGNADGIEEFNADGNEDGIAEYIADGCTNVSPGSSTRASGGHGCDFCAAGCPITADSPLGHSIHTTRGAPAIRAYEPHVHKAARRRPRGGDNHATAHRTRISASA